MSEAVRALLVSIACVGLLWGLFALVRHAKGRGRVMRSAAMFAALFGWGNMHDPRNDTVAEAQDGRIRRDEESGDPPDPPRLDR
jgi:hypothetical protein